MPQYHFHVGGNYITAVTAQLLPHALEDSGKRRKHAIARFCESLNISFKTGMELLRFCQAHHNLMS